MVQEQSHCREWCACYGDIAQSQWLGALPAHQSHRMTKPKNARSQKLNCHQLRKRKNKKRGTPSSSILTGSTTPALGSAPDEASTSVQSELLCHLLRAPLQRSPSRRRATNPRTQHEQSGAILGQASASKVTNLLP